MKRNRKFRFLFCLMLILCALVTSLAAGQLKISLRRSIVNGSLAKKPAQFSITWPDKKKASYLMDIGVNMVFGTKLIGNSIWEFASALEYHRNNRIDIEKNVLIGAFTMYGVLFDVTEIGWSLLPQVYLKYVIDEINKSRSVLVSSDIGWVCPSLAVGKIKGPEEFGFFWQPRVGIEYENIVKTEGENPKGFKLRFSGLVDAGLYPLKKTLHKQLELFFSYQFWRSLSKSGALEYIKNNFHLLSFSIKYYFNKKRNFALALEYVNGANPIESIIKQKYAQMTFQVRFWPALVKVKLNVE